MADPQPQQAGAAGSAVVADPKATAAVVADPKATAAVVADPKAATATATADPKATTVTAVVGQSPSEDSDADEAPVTVVQTVARAAFKLATTAVVYALGYWRLASVSTWVLLPLMACMAAWRDWRHEAHQLRRRRKQLAAIADEKTLVTANMADLPSWVFFPDVHRAEWLNQVSVFSPDP